MWDGRLRLEGWLAMISKGVSSGEETGEGGANELV